MQHTFASTMGDVISSISIGTGTAAADSIGYRAPARYRSNPTDSTSNWLPRCRTSMDDHSPMTLLLLLFLLLLLSILYYRDPVHLLCLSSASCVAHPSFF